MTVVTDEMVEAALDGAEYVPNPANRQWMRAALDAAMAVAPKPTAEELQPVAWRVRWRGEGPWTVTDTAPPNPSGWEIEPLYSAATVTALVAERDGAIARDQLWLDKTEWVQGLAEGVGEAAGMHRADVIAAAVASIRQTLSNRISEAEQERGDWKDMFEQCKAKHGETIAHASKADARVAELEKENERLEGALASLPWLVQYRVRGTGKWYDMVAFDVEAAATRYATGLSTGNSPWEYRSVPRAAIKGGA